MLDTMTATEIEEASREYGTEDVSPYVFTRFLVSHLRRSSDGINRAKEFQTARKYYNTNIKQKLARREATNSRRNKKS